MQLSERVYVVGSGWLGFGLSHDMDCHVYMIDGRSELALIDAGVGLGFDRIVGNIQAHGLDLKKLKYILLTHAHADHAGGCNQLRERFGVRIVASPIAANFLRAGDEMAVSLDAAKAGGFYPEDYHFAACPVDHELCEGDAFRIGDVELRAYDSSGHCSGMLSYLMPYGGNTHLFSGDSIFHGGRILMTNVYDCDFQQYVRNIRKLAALPVDVLLPGHLCVVLKGGQSHIQKALDYLNRMVLPPNII